MHVCNKLVPVACLALVAALLVAVQFGAGAPNLPAIDRPQAQLGVSARGRFAVPRLFDFANYKRIFDKSYASFTETLVRQKIFMSKALRALISMLNYKRGKLAYYLKINRFSDFTQEELDRMKNHLVGKGLFDKAVPVESRLEALKRLKKHSRDGLFFQPKHLGKILDSLAKVYPNDEDIAELRAELAYRTAVEGRKKLRKRRRVDGDDRAELSVDNLINTGDGEGTPAEALAKARNESLYENPQHKPPKLQETPREGNVSGGIRSQVTPTILLSLLKRQELEQYYKENNLDDYLRSYRDLVSNLVTLPEGGEDIVHVDLRESNCFWAPRDQGMCGSCYAFALISVAEWSHCKQTGELLAFSEQYIVDCGHLVGEELKGCDGGTIPKTMDFAYNFGFELATGYPYSATVKTCPIRASEDINTTGYIRIQNERTALVPVDRYDEYVREAPVLIRVSIFGDFHDYGGGVWERADCSELNHIVVLIGQGREDGHEYWLVRNSHSVGWGEGGYMKIAKGFTCAYSYDGFFFGFEDGQPNLQFKENERHDVEKLRNRFNEVLFEQVDLTRD